MKNLFALICLLLLVFIFSSSNPSMPQTQEAKQAVFPEKLLEGVAKFDLAILLQGDLRGNYGPCG